MSVPNIPDVLPKIDLGRNDMINMLIGSIALEEIGISNILEAEGDKIQAFHGTIEGQEVNSDVRIDDLERLDNIVNNTLDAITKKELLLLMKLQETEKVLEKNKIATEE